ncbi:MAG: prepilin-type N-terminal cleavage/methylation domain-containing protein [Elusimicrobiaceae bacterium]|nr:prepilin-type N-terminal cleavage/methylation domain-containing protein [Elusimicrobiaceae bacterium]
MNRRGFTLAEMLTVVLIVGLLLGLALPQYRRAIQKARATEAIAMLRTIVDSSERLATVYGYKTFKDFAAAHPDKAVFTRMDMFGDSASEDSSQRTLGCVVQDIVIRCKEFNYNLNPSGDFVYSHKNRNPYLALEFRMNRSDYRIRCGGFSGIQLSDEEIAEACDLYGFDNYGGAYADY